jgi:hypothetical protein
MKNAMLNMLLSMSGEVLLIMDTLQLRLFASVASTLNFPYGRAVFYYPPPLSAVI